MNAKKFIITLLLVLLVAGIAAAETRTLKVGVYDSRGVALAYGRSAEGLQRFEQLHRDRDAAEAAGDAAKVRELESQGPWLQERMHMQVFGNLPIDDILEGREAMLGEVAREAGVYVVVPSVAYKGPYVEVVDVTEAIALRFGADEETLTMVSEIGGQPSVELPFDFGDD